MFIHTTSFQNPQSIERSFLKACSSNQPLPLSQFQAQLNICTQDLQDACTGRTLTPDLARQYTATATNIHLVASFMSETHLDIENIIGDFSTKLDISQADVKEEAHGCVALPPHHSPTESAATLAPSRSITGGGKDTLDSHSHDTLKSWSVRHLSYLFPKKADLLDLASQTGLTENQVNLWFRNARTRSGWSKLYSNKLYANKDQQKLQSYFDEYEILRRLHGNKVGSASGSDPAYVLVEKILAWFRVKKTMERSDPTSYPQQSAPEESDNRSIRPWVKDVLFSTLASLRRNSFLSSSPAKKASYIPSLGWPNFHRCESSTIDPTLRSLSPESASDDVSGSSRSTSTSSTWSSISSSSSRSSSPCASSSGLLSVPAASPPYDSCSSSPRSTTTCLSLPLAPSQASSPNILSPAGSQPSYSDSGDSQLDLPPLHPSFFSEIVPPQSTINDTSPNLATSPISSPITLDPRLDTPTPLLSFFSSDTFSPPSSTHEPCSVASGQFDDAEED